MVCPGIAESCGDGSLRARGGNCLSVDSGARKVLCGSAVPPHRYILILCYELMYTCRWSCYFLLEDFSNDFRWELRHRHRVLLESSGACFPTKTFEARIKYVLDMVDRRGSL